MKYLLLFFVIFTNSCFHDNNNSLTKHDIQNLNSHCQSRKLPILKHSYSFSNEVRCYEDYQILKAIFIFYIEWEKKFGDPYNKIYTNLNDLSIVWSKNTEVVDNVYSVNGTKFDSSVVVGITLSPTAIWVYGGGRPISDTSFVHELVHLSIWTLYGGFGDYDHEGDKIKAWSNEHTKFIEDVNKILRINGI